MILLETIHIIPIQRIHRYNFSTNFMRKYLCILNKKCIHKLKWKFKIKFYEKLWLTNINIFFCFINFLNSKPLSPLLDVVVFSEKVKADDTERMKTYSPKSAYWRTPIASLPTDPSPQTKMKVRYFICIFSHYVRNPKRFKCACIFYPLDMRRKYKKKWINW